MAGRGGGGRFKRFSKNTSGPSKRPPLTHFLCLPLVNETSRTQLKASLAQFTNELANKEQLFHEKAIRPLGSLHLTLGVMSLTEDGQLEKAIEMLQNLDINNLLEDAENESPKLSSSGDATTSSTPATEAPREPAPEQVIPDETSSKTGIGSNAPREQSHIPSDVLNLLSGQSESLPQPSSNLPSLTTPISPPHTISNPSRSSTRPLSLSLSSLHPMHAPTNTSILYASANDPTSRLYPFCLRLQNLFTEAGFIQKENRDLKLHATLVNTIHAKKALEAKKPSSDDKANSAGDTPVTTRSSGVEAGSRGKGNSEDTMSEGSEAPASTEVDVDEKLPAGEKKAGWQTVPAAKRRNAGRKMQLKFDATTLIEAWKDMVWAENVRVEKVAICEMGAKKVFNEKGEVVEEKYTEVGSVDLP
ncbi:MAG: hypothetical protein M1820_004437 [Bogoriella megaspora]|nr:MAG: hypothetical protein M1820_004437 [Bogoriella megaspora]